VWKNSGVQEANERIWFQRWIWEGYAVRQLSTMSGHSSTWLYRRIDRALLADPPRNRQGIQHCQRAILDGIFFNRPKTLLVLMDAEGNRVVEGTYPVSERSLPQVIAFLSQLKEHGLSLKTCTVDGNPRLEQALHLLWPHLQIQRCVVHVQRQGLMWCRHSPQRPDARILRTLFRKVTRIATPEERDRFLAEVAAWEHRYGSLIAPSPNRGWVFRDLKRARSMLLHALPNLFHYVDDPRIPKSTNGLEGYFSHLRRHYRTHRGLHPSKRSAFFRWYLYYRSH
jgi:transposase-like protein